jgi:hypothetical protein
MRQLLDKIDRDKALGVFLVSLPAIVFLLLMGFALGFAGLLVFILVLGLIASMIFAVVKGVELLDR